MKMLLKTLLSAVWIYTCALEFARNVWVTSPYWRLKLVCTILGSKFYPLKANQNLYSWYCRLILILSLWSLSCQAEKISNLTQQHAILSIEGTKVQLCQFPLKLQDSGLLQVWMFIFNTCSIIPPNIKFVLWMWILWFHVLWKVRVMELCDCGRLRLVDVLKSGSLVKLSNM